MDKRIPPFELNFNNGYARDAYTENFSRAYTETFLPQAILDSGNKLLVSGQRAPRILDIGCGFAPMAHAMLRCNEACIPVRKGLQPSIVYQGIDIREDAINWLAHAYSDKQEYRFHLHKADPSCDYIGKYQTGKINNAITSQLSDGKECAFRLNTVFHADIQWSSSFFTHLTENAAREALLFVRSQLDAEGISINTWLIADSESLLAMNAGYADRQCTYDFGAYLSYSETNPLICTVYKLATIERLYQEAGLVIRKILRGSWRGSGNRNKYNHYQDIIIAGS